MRIDCLLPDLDGGGAQRTMVNLAGAFHADGLDVRLIAGRADGPAKNWLNPTVPLMNLHAPRVREMLFPLIRALKADTPDILFTTMIDANIVGFIAALVPRPGPQIVIRETNSQRARQDIGFLRGSLIKFCYPRADRVIALSEGVRLELIEDLTLNPQRAITIHNPIDLSAFSGAEARPPEMPDGRCLVAAGRLSRQKNFEMLIDVMTRLPEDVSLAILGEGGDRAALENQIAVRNLSDRVHLVGFVENTAAWFSHAVAFVLSSRWEGFGHVLAEAMAASAPVVATDCPHGPRDIIRDGENGLLVGNEDADGMAEAIRSLLDDAAFRNRIAEAGHESVDRFSVDKIAGAYRDLFQSMMGKN